MTPMGPGFFIFFQNENVAPLAISAPIAKNDDEEVLDVMKIIFTFLTSEMTDE